MGSDIGWKTNRARPFHFGLFDVPSLSTTHELNEFAARRIKGFSFYISFPNARQRVFQSLSLAFDVYDDGVERKPNLNVSPDENTLTARTSYYRINMMINLDDFISHFKDDNLAEKSYYRKKNQ